MLKFGLAKIENSSPLKVSRDVILEKKTGKDFQERHIHLQKTQTFD